MPLCPRTPKVLEDLQAQASHPHAQHSPVRLVMEFNAPKTELARPRKRASDLRVYNSRRRLMYPLLNPTSRHVLGVTMLTTPNRFCR